MPVYVNGEYYERFSATTTGDPRVPKIEVVAEQLAGDTRLRNQLVEWKQ